MGGGGRGWEQGGEGKMRGRAHTLPTVATVYQGHNHF